ncbi:MAG: acyltransferase family protein [Xanthobacteraceae bacterium]
MDAAHDVIDDAVALNLRPAPAALLRAWPSTDAGAKSTIGGIEGSRAAAAPRVASVDALRGFTILWILGGDAVAWALGEMSAGKHAVLSAPAQFFSDQLGHLEWEGFRFYDLILPLFIFVTGVSIVFSLTRLVEQEGKSTAHWRVVRRFTLLFALGLIYYGGASHNWPDIRLLGVLQRIALCYLFTSLLFLNFRRRGLIVASVALIVGYWALMTFVPVPDIGAGSFAKGANLANWIDAQYLPGSKWDGDWDPEGLLSTLPAIGNCLIGVFAGLLLRDSRVAPQRKSLWLIGAGVVMVAAGFLWGLQFPIIKAIWTSSFALVAAGLSALLLGMFYQVMDVWGRRAWATIFVWLGANAITLYFLNNTLNFKELATRLVGGDVGGFFDRYMTPGAGHFLAAAGGLALAIILAGFLYRRRIFLRV